MNIFKIGIYLLDYNLVIVMIELITMKVTVMLKLISLGLKNISCVGFKS